MLKLMRPNENGGENAGRIKIERDEIDENDWVQIQVAIEEVLITLTQKRRRVSLEKNFNCELEI
jgi:hypothetical protein